MELKPCPFCGQAPRIESPVVDFSFEFYVLRHDCVNSSVATGSRSLTALYKWWERKCENNEGGEKATNGK